MPDEGGKERIIPIRLENSTVKDSNNVDVTPPRSKESTPTPRSTTPRSSTTTPATADRVIPITRLSNGTAPAALNGHSNGSAVVNGFSTPVSSVNGGVRRPVPTVIGFRNNNLNNNSSGANADKGRSGRPL